MADLNVNYTPFTKFLEHHPSDFTLFRFRQLNIKNLLFYQAELAYLQRDLEDIEETDASVHAAADERVNFRWKPLEKAASGGAPSIRSQGSRASSPSNPSYSDVYIEKVLEIRETLAKYSSSY